MQLFIRETTFSCQRRQVRKRALLTAFQFCVARTGSGKTNIGLLTILQRLLATTSEGSPDVVCPSAKDFKVVYIAPMKSLVSEVARKYTTALAPLGLVVHELTADVHLSRRDLDKIHIIVTVPEKWDILTRSISCSGLSPSTSLLASVSYVHALLKCLRSPLRIKRKKLFIVSLDVK